MLCDGLGVARRALVSGWLATLLACGTGTITDPRGGGQAVNLPPVIGTDPSAIPGAVTSGQISQLSVTASDPEGGALTYAWTQVSPPAPAGSFNDASARNPLWTSPSVTAAGDVTLQVSVRDAQGGHTEKTVVVRVSPSANNSPPTVQPLAMISAVIAGATVNLSVTATDPDGDTLTYEWKQVTPLSPQGQFPTSGTNSKTTTWQAAEVSAVTTFTIQVSVRDGHNPDVVRTVDVQVGVPLYGRDIVPIWTAGGCLNCHDAGGRAPVLASGSYANLVNAATSVLNECMVTNAVRVLPGDPTNSILVRRITQTGCGTATRMPEGDPTYFDLNQGELIRIRSWISGGAVNN